MPKELLTWSAEKNSYFVIGVQCSADDKDSKKNIIHVLRYPRSLFDYICLGADDYTRQMKTVYEKTMDDALVLCSYDKEHNVSFYYANYYLLNSNEVSLRNQAMFDEHAVPSLRVNGPLPHIDEWYDAFGIKPGDKMYIPKERRVKIW